VEIDVPGHRTLAAVKRYAHPSDEHRAGVVQRGINILFELKPTKPRGNAKSA
jgi:hypothetical protein